MANDGDDGLSSRQIATEINDHELIYQYGRSKMIEELTGKLKSMSYIKNQLQDIAPEPSADVLAISTVPAPSILPTAVTAKKYGRFRVMDTEDERIIEDTQNNFPPYRFRRTVAAAKECMKFIRDYDAGNEQTHQINARINGAFQAKNKEAARFKKEQIFLLPRYDSKGKRYLNRQYSGRWRLWTDDEMKLPLETRLENFKVKHPQG